jgi:hypothetical protein
MSLTPYAEGFYAGIRYQRNQTLDFVSTHLDQGYQVTAEDIVAEINQAYKKDIDSKVNAMLDGSLDKLISQLDQIAVTVTDIEKQANELVADLGRND